jgi:hypothetical protein
MIARNATSHRSWFLFHCAAFVLVALGASAQPVLAADSVDANSVGRVLVAAGNTVAMRGSQSISLSTGSTIQNGDSLRTGENSNLQVRFIDDSIVSMKESSELRIDNFKFTGKADGSERASFTLLKGGLRTVTGAIGGKNNKNYRMVTNTATLGVRGTDYTITLCQQDCRNHDGSTVKDGLYGRVMGLSHGSNRIVVTTGREAKEFGINENFFVADNQSPVQRLIAPAEIVPNRLEGRKQPARQQALQESTPEERPKGEQQATQQVSPDAHPVIQQQALQQSAPATHPEVEKPQVSAGKEEAVKGGVASESRVNKKSEHVEKVEYIATQNLGKEGRSEVALPPRVVVYALDIGSADTVIEGNAATINADAQVTAIRTNDNDVTSVIADVVTCATCTLTATVQNTASVIDSGSVKLDHGSYMYWGRWGDGSVTKQVAGLTTVYKPAAGVPFVIGDAATQLPDKGSFTYKLAGGPSVVDAIGNIGGALTQGAFKVDYGSTQSISVATPLKFAVAGENFTLSSACGGACTFKGATTSMSMTLSGVCSGGVCANSSAATGNATGTLAGNQAGGLSVVGTVSSPAPTVTFAGAFKR